MDIYLTKKTRKNLEDIFNYSYDKWRAGEIEKEPTRAMIVRKLIDGLHQTMKESGDL